jgi:hypothetical protein
MKPLKGAVKVIKEFRRPYITLNVIYYGLVICGMILAIFVPSLQQSVLEAVRQSFSRGFMAVVVAAYRDGRVVLAMVLTFAVNLSLGSFASITLPSLVIPFSGLLIGVSRATTWGIMLSPTSHPMRMMMIPHMLTLILEGQGYILAMLAAYVQGSGFLFPRTVGVTGHFRGYGEGLKRAARLYLLVAIVLGVAAVYEALEVIYIVPLLVGAS